MTNFTPEQEAAINPPYDRNLIMVAGAGSGKTRVLVERYLRLLEAHPDWQLNDLVAITFTQKAAQEMRDRVRQRVQYNMRLANAAGDEVTQRRWARRLGAMSSARIDTIHALCGALLRANAPEAGLDPGFTVVDEVESAIMVEDTIERVLFQMVNAGEAPMLALFSRYDAGTIRVELQRHASAPPLDAPPTGAALLRLWRQTWATGAAPAFQSARNHYAYQNALAWANANRAHFPPGDKLTAKWHATHDALQLLATLPPGGPLTGVYGWLRTIADNRAGSSGAKTKWKAVNVQDARDVLNGLVDEWAAPLLGEMGAAPDATDEAAADLAAAWGVLIQAVQAGYAAAKAADNLLDFNDLERRAADLLRDPAVRDRYTRKEFKHVLVDEFQDTNADQWRIIQALTAPDEPLNGDPARLFVVGDPKQSIYGFRGGDVSVFEHVRRQITSLPTPDGQPAEIPLLRSFRTHRPLVNAFNYIFERLLQKDPASPVVDYEVAFGEPMQAHREHPPTSAPPLELTLLDQRPRDANDRPLEGTNCGNKGLIATDVLRAQEAAHIAARIQEMVTSGERVHDKETNTERPLGYGDVALLFRKSAPMVIYENALRAAGVPYVTVAGRGYYDRQEVWDLLALLDALYNPNDDLALATALRSPLFNLSDEALYGLRLPAPGKTAPASLWDALARHADTRVPAAEVAAVARARAILGALAATAGRVTIYELLRDALAQTGYLATLTGLPDGVRRRNNVLKLLQKAVESDRVTLSAFTQYLNDMTDREVREGEADTEAADAVTLMTAHKSKGLEFPVVFLPDASATGGGRNQPIVRPAALGGVTCRVPDDVGDLQDPNLFAAAKALDALRAEAEARRLLYVAATRARDRLFVSGFACWKGETWARLTGWVGLLVAAFGLETWAGTDETLTLGDGADRFAVRVRRLRGDVQQPEAVPQPPALLWDTPAVRTGQPSGTGGAAPPLVRPVPREQGRVAYHLTASQIADLGGALYGDRESRRYYADKFRRSVVYGAPGGVKSAHLPGDSVRPVPQRVLGDIAHEALRWWRFPRGADDMRRALESYAWRHKVVEPAKIKYAVEMTHGWLTDFRQNVIYRWAETAQQVERELPFVYHTDRHVIHGVLDMLLQKPDGTWVLVDYKSSTVRGFSPRDEAERANRLLLKTHAERYYIQVGVYAAAVVGYLASRGVEIAPEGLKVYIYYLQYAETVPVPYARWRAALDELETQIGKLIEDETP